MVLNELIPMLSSQGLDTSRVAFLGWSMGGYGALLLGSRLGPTRTAAICAVSRRCGSRRGGCAGSVRRRRRLGGELGVRPACAGGDPDPGGLRQQ
ncbi:putative cONSERVED EXPORTED PROTEIN [Mycobacterium xenopi 3993]|nr:putative cONSERVED EXPORTED PROTEIN [Mycobacterium xenopi 3993]